MGKTERGVTVGVGEGVEVGVGVGVEVRVGVEVEVRVGAGVGVGVGLAVAVAVGEGVRASAANTGIFVGTDQASALPAKMTSRPRATAAPGRLHRRQDAGATDVDGYGSSWGAGEVTRRRAHRSAA